VSPKFERAEPQLYVMDLEASLRYFSEKLGFTVEFSYGDPPFYGQVKRGRARLNLRSIDAPVVDPAVREREQLLSATIALDDAAALFAEYTAAGADIMQPLRMEPWGAQTFIVRDRDGNLILFAGDAAP
jgi:uncharacterized glyoxalase superfamily protein PhnB